MFKVEDDRNVTIQHAFIADAKDLHRGFCSVVDEGKWLPTFKAVSSLSDWAAWIQRIQRSDEVLLVARIDETHAGHLTLQPEEWAASKHVAKLGIIVLAQFRKIGVGRALMLAAEEAAKEAGYTKIILSTFISNEVARHLYESLGYRLVGFREKHFLMPDGYIDEILFEKMLE